MDCLHSQTKLELLPPTQEHYAAVKCYECGKTLCFKPHPHVVARRQRNAANIQRLLGNTQLSPWESGFLSGLTQNPRPTRQQQAQLERLVEKYLTQDTNILHGHT